MRIKRWLWLSLGLISLVFVGIGAVVPMLPYFPFLMLSTFCFAKSSETVSYTHLTLPTMAVV